MSSQQYQNAKYGTAGFEKSAADLPSVFPREMGPNTMKYLQEVVESGLESDIVARTEAELAEGHGRKYCLLTPGCTNALFSLFNGLDFAPGSEIIVSAIADYGDICGLLFEHYIPVFCDTEPGTGLASAETIAACITPRTRAILVVNFFGLPCDYDPLMALAQRHGLLVIEDVCQSILSTYKGRISGALADVAVFSFDSEKTLGADMGGAIMTDNEQLYRNIVNRSLSRGAVHVAGFGRKHLHRGLALRASLCTAATVLANWEIIRRQVEQRQKMASLLNGLISDIQGLTIYRVPDNRTHSYWMYGFTIDPDAYACSVAELAARLTEAGFACGMGKYYVLPAAVPFLQEHADQGDYPFNLSAASRGINYNYNADEICPHAVRFMNNWIRTFWTEKYKEEDIFLISHIIHEVCNSNLAVKT